MFHIRNKIFSKLDFFSFNNQDLVKRVESKRYCFKFLHTPGVKPEIDMVFFSVSLTKISFRGHS